MGNKFESILSDKIRGNNDLLVFKQQLETIKLYVPDKLKLIAQIFPHYSSHDESHSIKILNNIWQIIGENSALLFSVTDLWLLLASAYLHDSGMIVLRSDFENCFTKKEFKKYIEECQKNTSHDLHETAMLFDIDEKSDKIFYKKTILNFKSYNAARYLIADFYRKHHAERSSEFITANEITTIPSTIIPRRIKTLLAEICRAHTESFKKVMRLPFVQNGIDTEYCHPRYIACLLRLGDLLDLDNNRFSIIRLESLGDSYPKSTNNHLGKHESFNRLLFNTNEISIQSICKEYEEAEETLKVINVLKKELNNQKKNWTAIVPDKCYGFLPKLTNYKVILKNYNKLLRQEAKKFALNRSKVLELLQGSGIYSRPSQAIRELIQNAIDATIIRVWKENTNKGTKTLIDKCKKQPIEITINKAYQNDSEDKILWKIKIRDYGCGMNLKEITSLVKALSSSENKLRNEIIEEMPEWFKPSGIFGIGFQSVFLITDKVHIKSKSLNSNKVIELDIPRIRKGKESLLAIKWQHQNEFQTGTEMSFQLIFNKIPERFNIAHDNTYKEYAINNYDFIKDSSLDIEIAEIIDEINKFSFASLIPIIINYNNEPITLKPKSDYLNEDDNTVSILNVIPKSHMPRILYRGQNIENSNLKFYFVGIIANIISSNAKELLTINRNSLREEKRTYIWKQCLLASYKFIKNKEDKSEEEKIYFSMFINFYKVPILSLITNKENEKENKYIIVNKDYEKLRLNNNLTLKEVLSDCKEITFKDSIHNIIISYKSNKDEEKEVNIDFELELFIFTISQNYGFNYFEYNKESNITLKKDISIENTNSISGNFLWRCKIDYKTLLLKNYFSINFKRFMLPCSEEYEILAIDKDKLKNYLPLSSLPKLFINNYPVMISPVIFQRDEKGYSQFKLLEDDNEILDYINFVIENSAEPKDKEEIKKSLIKLIELFSNFIDEINKNLKLSPYNLY